MAIHHTLEQVQLQNRVSGLFVHTPGAPVTAYVYQFRSGSDVATRAYPFQIAHTLEHIVEAGPDSPRYSKKSDFIQELQKNGAWRNAFTGEFGISYVGDCVPDELLRILKLRLSAAEKPKLQKDILKSESGNVLEEMRQRVADYVRLAGALSRKVLNDGAWQTSKEAMIDAESVTLPDVLQYYKRTHTIDNLRFIIVGDIAKDKRAIVDLFGTSALSNGKRLDGPAPKLSTVDTYSYEHRPGLESIFTNFSLAIPRQLAAKEVAAMQIINNLLCNPWDSRILGKARDAGLCYSMRGSAESLKTQTVWSFDTPIGPTNATEFFALMTDALKDFSTLGPSDAEITKTKALLIGQAKKNGQTTQELLNMYAEDYFGLDTVTPSEDRIKLLEAVTTKDIVALVKEFVLSKSKVLSGVGSIDETEFEKQYIQLANSLSDSLF